MHCSFFILFLFLVCWLVYLFVRSFICRGGAETSSLLETWRIINLMRVLGAVLGWVLVAVQPTKDYTARK